MNVLSLFDGMSCGRIALERAGIKVDNYFASEIDKYAIQVSKKNYPDIHHIGDVIKIDTQSLPKIDLLIGGSPCQGFSFAGKQLNFNDPRSKLFFEYVRILKELRAINPDIKFLLENVRMKKEFQDIISQELGVQPIAINSALVSAQNRYRLYWTNIPNIQEPEDKGIYLKDIIEQNVPEKYFMNQEFIAKLNRKVTTNKKAYALAAKTSYSARNHNRSQCNLVGELDMKGIESIKRVYDIEGKSPTLTTMEGGHRQPKILCVPEATKKGFVEIQPEEGVDLTFPESKTRRGRRMEDKSNCLTATNYDYMWWNGMRVRKITPVECERLQTVPDNYTDCVSDSQRYKMLGNGWTVDVIAHILKNL